MGWGHIAGLAIGLAAIVAPAAAQEADHVRCGEEIALSRTIKLDSEAPFAVVSFQPGLFRFVGGGNCRVFGFYRLSPELPPTATAREFRQKQAEYRDKTAAPLFFARQISDDGNVWRERWSDPRTCPALAPALAKLEEIVKPRFVGDGPYREGQTSITDQPYYELWVKQSVYPQINPLYELQLTLKSTGGETAFSIWFEETRAALQSCWIDKPPELR